MSNVINTAERRRPPASRPSELEFSAELEVLLEGVLTHPDCAVVGVSKRRFLPSASSGGESHQNKCF